MFWTSILTNLPLSRHEQWRLSKGFRFIEGTPLEIPSFDGKLTFPVKIGNSQKMAGFPLTVVLRIHDKFPGLGKIHTYLR